jgi:hypothetical protein
MPSLLLLLLLLLLLWRGTARAAAAPANVHAGRPHRSLRISCCLSCCLQRGPAK